MVPQRDARRVVRQRPESACLVEWEAAVIGKLRSSAAFHEVLVQNGRPVAAQINRWCLSGYRCGDLRSLPTQCDAEHHAGHDRINLLPDPCGRDEERDQGVPVFYDYVDYLRVPRIKLDFHEALESLLGKQLTNNGGRVQAIAEREAELVLVYGFGSPR